MPSVWNIHPLFPQFHTYFSILKEAGSILINSNPGGPEDIVSMKTDVSYIEIELLNLDITRFIGAYRV
ncbi:hypothetical protein ABEI56_10985 [Peribacillus castrilensis]|uniref:hypothetical protein n=1 Tax=Peribacillus castrilensis TaxID=2897690 RepID=UPI003D2C6DAA